MRIWEQMQRNNKISRNFIVSNKDLSILICWFNINAHMSKLFNKTTLCWQCRQIFISVFFIKQFLNWHAQKVSSCVDYSRNYSNSYKRFLGVQSTYHRGFHKNPSHKAIVLINHKSLLQVIKDSTDHFVTDYPYSGVACSSKFASPWLPNDSPVYFALADLSGWLPVGCLLIRMTPQYLAKFKIVSRCVFWGTRLRGVCHKIFWVLFWHVWIDLGLYKNLWLFSIFSVEPRIL
jgi:hypothetical protein